MRWAFAGLFLVLLVWFIMIRPSHARPWRPDVAIDPMLGPLQNNGGPTETMAVLAGSPALNAGDPSQLGVADQRGVVRDGGVNIGAYQASASANPKRR
jgi:hypothetical protein